VHYMTLGRDSMCTLGTKSADAQKAPQIAREMIQSGRANVSIQDSEGRKIDGDDLLACVKGEKVLSDDLRAHYVS
jgi:hypothetical protein